MAAKKKFTDTILEEQFGLLRPIPAIVWPATLVFLASLFFGLPRMGLVLTGVTLGLLFLASALIPLPSAGVSGNAVLIALVIVFSLALNMIAVDALEIVQLASLTLLVTSIALVLIIRFIRAITRPSREQDYVLPSTTKFLYRLLFPGYNRDLDLDAPAHDQIVLILKNRKGATDMATLYLEIDKGETMFQDGRPATLREVFDLAENSNLEISQRQSSRLFS